MCVLVGFLFAEDPCEVTFFPSRSQRSAMGLFLPPLGHSSLWWALCRSHQLRLMSGTSGTEISGGRHAGAVWGMAFTTGQPVHQVICWRQEVLLAWEKEAVRGEIPGLWPCG